MKNFTRKHIFFIIFVVLCVAFPVSLSTQARLNMRIIVTGLAIDKSNDEYEITAQFVKTSPSAKQIGESKIEFISDKDKSITGAISKLLYKTGKISALSHTGFILLGDGLKNDDLTQTLDYFVRDNVVEDSVLLAFSSGEAKEELKKTREIDISVGLGLQKVFLYKQKESDGIMTSLLSFLKRSKDESKTVVVSEMKLSTAAGDGEKENNENQDSQSNENNQGSEGHAEKAQGGGDSSSSGEKGQYFDATTPINCFVSGKYVGKLEEPDEIEGYMLAKNKCKIDDITLSDLNFGKLNNAKISIKIKNKSNKISFCFEGGIPRLDINVSIKNAEIKEIHNKEIMSTFTKEEFEFIKKEMAKAISGKIAASFKKAQELGADIFGAYNLANRFYYGKTKADFNELSEFLNSIKLNVTVKTNRLEY